MFNAEMKYYSFIKNPLVFKSVLSNGTKIYKPHFFAFVEDSSESHMHFRLGLIASRKVGKAVYRNKCKRQIKAIWRELMQDQKIVIQTDKVLTNTSCDLIIIVRTSMCKANFKDIKQDLKHIWRKISNTRQVTNNRMVFKI